MCGLARAARAFHRRPMRSAGHTPSPAQVRYVLTLLTGESKYKLIGVDEFFIHVYMKNESKGEYFRFRLDNLSKKNLKDAARNASGSTSVWDAPRRTGMAWPAQADLIDASALKALVEFTAHVKSEAAAEAEAEAVNKAEVAAHATKEAAADKESAAAKKAAAETATKAAAEKAAAAKKLAAEAAAAQAAAQQLAEEAAAEEAKQQASDAKKATAEQAAAEAAAEAAGKAAAAAAAMQQSEAAAEAEKEKEMQAALAAEEAQKAAEEEAALEAAAETARKALAALEARKAATAAAAAAREEAKARQRAAEEEAAEKKAAEKAAADEEMQSPPPQPPVISLVSPSAATSQVAPTPAQVEGLKEEVEQLRRALEAETALRLKVEEEKARAEAEATAAKVALDELSRSDPRASSTSDSGLLARIIEHRTTAAEAAEMQSELWYAKSQRLVSNVAPEMRATLNELCIQKARKAAEEAEAAEASRSAVPELAAAQKAAAKEAGAEATKSATANDNLAVPLSETAKAAGWRMFWRDAKKKVEGHESPAENQVFYYNRFSGKMQVRPLSVAQLAAAEAAAAKEAAAAAKEAAAKEAAAKEAVAAAPATDANLDLGGAPGARQCRSWAPPNAPPSAPPSPPGSSSSSVDSPPGLRLTSRPSSPRLTSRPSPLRLALRRASFRGSQCGSPLKRLRGSPLPSRCSPTLRTGLPPPLDKATPEFVLRPPLDKATPEFVSPPPLDKATPEFVLRPPLDKATPEFVSPPPLDKATPNDWRSTPNDWRSTPTAAKTAECLSLTPMALEIEVNRRLSLMAQPLQEAAAKQEQAANAETAPRPQAVPEEAARSLQEAAKRDDAVRPDASMAAAMTTMVEMLIERGDAKCLELLKVIEASNEATLEQLKQSKAEIAKLRKAAAANDSILDDELAYSVAITAMTSELEDATQACVEPAARTEAAKAIAEAAKLAAANLAANPIEADAEKHAVALATAKAFEEETAAKALKAEKASEVLKQEKVNLLLKVYDTANRLDDDDLQLFYRQGISNYLALSQKSMGTMVTLKLSNKTGVGGALKIKAVLTTKTMVIDDSLHAVKGVYEMMNIKLGEMVDFPRSQRLLMAQQAEREKKKAALERAKAQKLQEQKCIEQNELAAKEREQQRADQEAYEETKRELELLKSTPLDKLNEAQCALKSLLLKSIELQMITLDDQGMRSKEVSSLCFLVRAQSLSFLDCYLTASPASTVPDCTRRCRSTW